MPTFRGGVKFPTGGEKSMTYSPRALAIGKVSRSGVIPGPTVTVRMEEGERLPASLGSCIF